MQFPKSVANGGADARCRSAVRVGLQQAGVGDLDVAGEGVVHGQRVGKVSDAHTSRHCEGGRFIPFSNRSELEHAENMA